MIRLIRFFKHYNNVYSSMLNKIKVKLLEYGYKAEHDSFYVIFYIGEKLYLIELVKFQIRLFNNEEDYYFDDVESMLKKITELRDKEAV